MKKLLFASLLLLFAAAAQAQIQGLGYSTGYCLDRDGDGYGIGPWCVGVDADDLDSSVRTAAEGIAKYSTLSAFLTKLGKDIAADSAGLDSAGIAAAFASPNHTWYLAPASASPAGSDSNACNSISVPCLTISRLVAQGYGSGDLIIARQDWNGALSMVSGTAAKYSAFLSYPGEQAILTGAAGNNGSLADTHDVIIDGLKIQNGSQLNGGTTDGAGSNLFHHVLLAHIDGGSGGTSIGAVDLFNGLSYLDVEDSVFHDNSCGGGGCQHGMYNGSRELPSDHVTYRRLIAFGNGANASGNGLTFNGRCTNCAFTQIITYNNGISGLTLEMGVKNSTVSSILSFNNQKAINFFNYAGNCFDLGNGSATVNTQGPAVTWVSSADGGDFVTGAAPGGTGISINGQWYSVASVTDNHHLVLNQSAGVQTGVVYYQSPPICPYDQTGNVIENVTAYNTGHLSDGTDNTTGSAIAITNYSPGAIGDLGHNTWRNIIVVSWGNNNHYSPWLFADCNGQGDANGCGGPHYPYCGTACQGWMSTTTVDYVVYQQTDGSDGNGLFAACTGPGCNSFGFASYTCAAAASAFSITATHCTNADPKFMRADPSYYNAVNLFNFRLKSASPALNACTATGAPAFDAYGVPFMATPSCGAIEDRMLYASGWTDLGTKLTTAMCPPYNPAGDPNGSVDSNGTPYNYPANCHNITDAWNGGTAVLGFLYRHAQINGDSGGHTDYLGNEIYSTTYGVPAPTSSRITNADTFSSQDWIDNGVYALPNSTKINPNSRHITNGIAYIQWLNKMMVHNGALAGNGNTPGHRHDSWIYDFASGTWAALDPVDCTNHGSGFTSCAYGTVGRQVDPLNEFSGDGFYGAVLPDNSTQTVFVVDDGNTVMQYYPQQNQFILRALFGSTLQPPADGGAGFTAVLVNTGSSKFIIEWGNGKVYTLDVSGLAAISDTHTITETDVTSSIGALCSSLVSAHAPHLAFDLDTGKIFGKDVGSASSYVIDPSDWSCVAGPAGGPSGTVGSNGFGAAYTRTTYDADLKTFVVDTAFGTDYYIANLRAKGSASALRKVNGDTQSAATSTQLPVLLSVQVVDSAGMPIAGSTVMWAVTAGGGSLSASSATTDVNGVATTSLTLGAAAGSNTVTATDTGLTGSPVTFTATAVGGAAPIGRISSPGSGSVSGRGTR